MKSRNWMAWSLSLLVGLGMGLGVARAQDHDHDDHHDNGNHYGEEKHKRFDEHDRHEARVWYASHHDYFQHEEGRYWHRQWEPDIHEGFILTPEMRGAWRPVPHDLSLRLGPVPHGWRYGVIGDHVCLVDPGWQIRDVLHFEVGF